MRVVLFLICLLVYFLVTDFRLRFLFVLKPSLAFRYMTHFQKRAARMIFALSKAYVKFRLRIESDIDEREISGPCLIISNHQSLADIPALVQALPGHDLKFVTKRQLRKWVPLISMVIRAGRHASVFRHGQIKQSYRELSRLANLAKKGFSPVVFPEGTRSRTGEVMPFHPAAVRIILNKTPLPVLLVALDGGAQIASLSDMFDHLPGTVYKIKLLGVYQYPKTKGIPAAPNLNTWIY